MPADSEPALPLTFRPLGVRIAINAAGGVLLARVGTSVVPWAIAVAYALAALAVPLLPRIAPVPAGSRIGGGPLGARAFWLVVPASALIQGSHAAYYAFAALHCALGDVLITACSLVAALLLFGKPEWPRRRFVPVAAAAAGTGDAHEY